jgi:CheY-like chemotaxis protein
MADPDESLVPVYREQLLHEGFELDTAINGLECVVRLRERVPDVLILEPHMPWGGGVGVLAMMSETPQFTTIPVMVLTSCCDPHVLAGIERFPINDYQVKPLTPDRLAERLRLLLNYPKLHFAMADHNGRLECAITRRTDGRVWDLRVEVCDGNIMVHGRSDSHHVKQLVLAAVTEALQASGSPSSRIELDIEVTPDEILPFRKTTLSGARNSNYSR